MQRRTALVAFAERTNREKGKSTVHSGRLLNGTAGVGPAAMIGSTWANRHLIWRLAKRELAARYRGSILGMAWAVLNPLLMLLVYTFVFGTVLQARWGTGANSQGEFALLVFSGMILFTIFAECVSRAPGLMLENVSYIKKVVFPLEIMPVVGLVVALCNAGISFLTLAVFYAMVLGTPPVTVFLLPLLLVPLCLLTLGLSWFFAAAGVFLRDLRQLVSVMVTMMMFMSPIFYPVSAIPENIRPLLMLNPLLPVLEGARELLFWGGAFDWTAWGVATVLGGLASVLGYAWFAKTRKGFADVV